VNLLNEMNTVFTQTYHDPATPLHNRQFSGKYLHRMYSPLSAIIRWPPTCHHGFEMIN